MSMAAINSIQFVTEEVRKNMMDQNIGLSRSKFRHLCHRIREGRIYDKFVEDRAPGVKFIVEKQFRKVIIGQDANGKNIWEAMSWANFTFVWDIHPTQHLRIISADQWQHEGGDFDKDGYHTPSAFTNQVSTPNNR